MNQNIREETDTLIPCGPVLYQIRGEMGVEPFYTAIKTLDSNKMSQGRCGSAESSGLVNRSEITLWLALQTKSTVSLHFWHLLVSSWKISALHCSPNCCECVSGQSGCWTLFFLLLSQCPSPCNPLRTAHWTPSAFTRFTFVGAAKSKCWLEHPLTLCTKFGECTLGKNVQVATCFAFR